MSKHEDDFGVGATGAIRFPTAPTAAAPPKKVLHLGRAVPRPAAPAMPRIVVRPAGGTSVNSRMPSMAAAKQASELVRKPSFAVPASTGLVKRPTASSLLMPTSAGTSKMSPAYSPIEREAGIAAAAAAAASGVADAGQQSNPQVWGGGGPTAAEPEPMPQQQDDWTPPDTSAMQIASMPSATVPPAVPKESFWKRLLALFGFGKKDAAIHGEGSDLRSMTASVVRRARNGDQNAMALIALIRDNAKKGHPRAVESFEHLREYISTHPVDANPRIGGEPDFVALTQAPGTRWAGDSTYADAVALSHGPKLTNPRIGAFLSQFGGEEQAAVAFGIRHKGDASERHSNRNVSRAIRMGKIVGQARSIQAVREDGSPVSAFDKGVGWELEGD
jgi:hypothetical protein